MALCNLEDIYTYLRREDTGSSPSDISLEEEQWTALILSSQKKIENICNRKFDAADYLEYIDGENSTLLFTEQFPINSLTSITFIAAVDESSTSVVDLDDVRIDYDLGELFRVTNWTEGKGNYKVSYNAGYSEGSIPDDLNLICVQDVLFEASKADKNINESLKSEKIGDHSYTNLTGSEQDELLKSKLQKYINNF